MTKGLVLVSGATGFVGTAVVRAFVEAGYAVRATSRSQTKADQWATFNPEHAANVEWTIVPDGSVPNAWDDAVKGVDYVAHTASPFHFHTKDNEKDMLIPAIHGTKSMLSAVKKEPKVKHMVITSSIAAVVNFSDLPGAGKVYTRESWNPVTWDEAIKSTRPAIVYAGSKKLAEKVAWEDTERSFPVTTICPPLILGPGYQPISSLSELNTSLLGMYALMSGKKVPNTGRAPWAVDVRDVAALHVHALAAPPPPGTPSNAQRFLASAWSYFERQFCEYLRSSPSELAAAGIDWRSRVSDDFSQDPVVDHAVLDGGKESKALLRRPYISQEQCFKDSALRLVELEELLKGKESSH